MFKSFEDIQKFSAEQLSAATQSATAVGHGVQQLLAETAALSKQTAETGTTALQSLVSSRSIDKAMQIQYDFARSALDSMVAGSTRMGGIVSTTAQDALKPLEAVFNRMQRSPTN